MNECMKIEKQECLQLKGEKGKSRAWDVTQIKTFQSWGFCSLMQGPKNQNKTERINPLCLKPERERWGNLET